MFIYSEFMFLQDGTGLSHVHKGNSQSKRSLQGERIGYIHVRCASKDAADAVLSQMKIIVRQATSRAGVWMVRQTLWAYHPIFYDSNRTIMNCFSILFL